MGRPLYVAAGGGGDAIGSYLVATTIGPSQRPAVLTWSWDRLVVDPLPGPRNPSDFRKLHQVTSSVFQVLPNSESVAPAESTLPRLAGALAADLFLVDPRHGAVGVAGQVAELVDYLRSDQLLLVDVGGDVLAVGDEAGLLSPLADGIALAAVAEQRVPADVLVTGLGLDGELSEPYMRERLTELGSAAPWGRLDADAVAAVAGVFRWHPTEATGLLAAASGGIRGRVRIRDSGAVVTMHEGSPDVWRVSATSLLVANRVATAVRSSTSLEEAELQATAVSSRSELAYERRKASAPGVVRDVASASDLAGVLADLDRQTCLAGAEFFTLRALQERVGDTNLGRLASLVEAQGRQVQPPLVEAQHPPTCPG